MGKTYDQLDKRLHGWIAAQRIFFVATAPHRRGGHVNLSPKTPRGRQPDSRLSGPPTPHPDGW